ncbi:MAG: AMMECR1 domain-containing protein [Acidobacteriota bacterium]|nr:AMMECR1 domain-containing protein [Acidobacteriota bacterium]
MMVSEEERDFLRRVARDAGARAVGLRVAPAPSRGIEAGSRLSLPAPVFVTWRKDGRQRGRSGSIEANHALAAAVEEHAVAALLHDPRIPPATARELPRYTPEISVLFTFEEIFSSPSASEASVSSLLPLTHGVVAEKGKRRGVVLPQDAAGFDWDAARLLSQACLRAGLPEESWKAASPPRLLRFTAEVF